MLHYHPLLGIARETLIWFYEFFCLFYSFLGLLFVEGRQEGNSTVEGGEPNLVRRSIAGNAVTSVWGPTATDLTWSLPLKTFDIRQTIYLLLLIKVLIVSATPTACFLVTFFLPVWHENAIFAPWRTEYRQNPPSTWIFVCIRRGLPEDNKSRSGVWRKWVHFAKDIHTSPPWWTSGAVLLARDAFSFHGVTQSQPLISI